MESSEEYFLDEEYIDAVEVSRIRRNLRDSANPLELPDSLFISYFRLNKEAFLYVLNEIKDSFRKTIRTSSIPPILKLCAALRFFAEGSYQKSSGNDFNVGQAQSTVSMALKEVLDIFESRICAKWIRLRMTHEEETAAKLHFYEKCGFPGVLGCIDGTHIKIISPSKDLQHLYMNKKGFYSINAMILCDHKLSVRYVDARYPGSNHDSYVFNMSELSQYLEDNLSESSWILGDAGYPLKSYLLTPFRTAEPGTPEARYNSVHAKAHNTIERALGVLKNRFGCLLSTRSLHYKPEKATQIINTCCALHNICQHFNVEDPDFIASSIDQTQSENDEDFPDNSIIPEAAIAIRNNVMQCLQ